MKNFLILTAIIFLTGCAAQVASSPAPALTLEQRLAGKNDDEQRALLKEMCLQEAQTMPFDKIVWNFYGENSGPTMLAQICKKMAEKMKPCTVEMH